METYQLKLEALRLAQVQLPPSTPIPDLLAEAEKIFQFIVKR